LLRYPRRPRGFDLLDRAPIAAIRPFVDAPEWAIAEDDVSCRVVEMEVRVEELRRAPPSFTFDPAPEFATQLRRLLRIDRKQPVFGQNSARVGIPTGPDPGVHVLAEAL
jgi:hypothetical protein